MFVPQVLATRHNYNKPNEQTNADESLPSIPFATRTQGSRIGVNGVPGYALKSGQRRALCFSAPGDFRLSFPRRRESLSVSNNIRCRGYGSKCGWKVAGLAFVVRADVFTLANLACVPDLFGSR